MTDKTERSETMLPDIYIRKSDLDRINEGNPPKNLELYREGQLHYEFGDMAADYVTRAVIDTDMNTRPDAKDTAKADMVAALREAKDKLQMWEDVSGHSHTTVALIRKITKILNQHKNG